MDEASWLASNEPAAMLQWLRALNEAAANPAPASQNWPRYVASDRKLRLFACACARLFYPKLLADPREVDFLPAIERAESAADQGISPPVSGEWIVSEREASFAARMTVENLVRHGSDLGAIAAVLRDIFGNPFRPMTIGTGRQCNPYYGSCGLWSGHRGQHNAYAFRIDTAWLAWSDGTVSKLARVIYEERRYEDMPILADALEEAGCPQDEECETCEVRITKGKKAAATVRMAGVELSLGSDESRKVYLPGCIHCGGTGKRLNALLAHLRGPGPHARGCWVLDLLQGKE